MNLDRPMTFNELIDEKKLDEEYESIKIKIKSNLDNMGELNPVFSVNFKSALYF